MASGKERIDKYYKLAKEKGYRARSAFKLLEINRKFGFLKNAHIAIDLCAAPGGWMQVLLQEMPYTRKVIGVDLDYIKPLGKDAISFVGDITTLECRRTLVELLDGHQADIFLHDGSPNFGTSKEIDKYVQNELVIHALKLSTEFLIENGTFVTKIFRSENFSTILKVLNTLFKQVDVTKPLSSRMDSAEIFAVCRGYKNPDEISPDMLNPKILFKTNNDDNIHMNVYKNTLLSDFIKEKDNSLLRTSGSFIVDFKCDLITSDFLEMFKDLKIIPIEDIKKIINKKKTIRHLIQKGILDIPILNSLNQAEENKIENMEKSKESNKIENMEKLNKIDEINIEINKIKKKERKDKRNAFNNSLYKENIPIHHMQGNNRLESHIHDNNIQINSFYEDRIFEDFNSTEYPDREDNPLDKEEENPVHVEISSCSDSLEMTESEMRCAIYMKEVGTDKFEESTIDRYMISNEEGVLSGEKRISKLEEQKIPKKKIELLSRKRARAMRRASKMVNDIMVEDEKEETITYKKIFKNLYKKDKPKPILIFPSKRAHFIRPRKNGRILFVDRRMKHDLRIQKQRKKLKKR